MKQQVKRSSLSMYLGAYARASALAYVLASVIASALVTALASDFYKFTRLKTAQNCII